MERTTLVALLALLAGAQFAAAGTNKVQKTHGLIFGKGKAAPLPMSTGKGDVTTDVQCTQACKDVCVPVPNKVCNDVPYQTQVCNKVPVTLTKQKCDRVCTRTQTYTQTVTTGKGKGMSYGKGKGMAYGRRLFGTNKKDGLIGALLGGKGAAVSQPMSYGKGMAAPNVDVNCQDVCQDVPYTTYTTQCNTITKTKTMCDIVYQQQCDKVCKPVCQKITTVTTTTTQSLGKGMPVMMGKGKGMH